MGSEEFRWKDFDITVDYTRVVNYALQRNDLPVIQGVHIENAGEAAVEDVAVEIHPQDASGAAAEGADGWSGKLARLEPGDIWNTRDIQISFPREELVQLDERKESELSVSLSMDADTSPEFELGVARLPYNQWPGVGVFPQSLAAFVLPNHPDIAEVVTRMRDVMERWTGDGSLEGYQATDRERIRKMAASSFIALRELGFSYVNPPASFENAGQKVRTPEQMLNSRMGTCLDLTLLVAAAMEHIGLRPILVVIRGHAFVGAWLEPNTFAEPLVDDGAELRKREKLGQTVFFDPTPGVTDEVSFEEAEEIASNHLGRLDQFVVGIDVHAARLDGIFPIASRVIGEDGRVRVFDHSDRETETDSAVPSQKLDLEELERRAAAHLEQVEAGEEEREDSLQRLERWRSKLLDLSLRNRLLNFKHTYSTSILMHHDLGDLEDELAKGRTFAVEPKPSLLGAVEPLTDESRQLYDRDQLQKKLSDSLSNGRLHTSYPPAEHNKRLKKIHRRARRELQETGVNLLHVGLGFLRWFDPNSSNTSRIAPLVLLPAKLERQSASDRYKLQLTDDEAFINQSLLQKLKKEFGLEVEGVSVLPEDASGLHIDLIFKQFREAVLEMKGWDVFEDACLGIFSFGSFLMWHDLKENEDRLFENEVVRGILEPGESIETGQLEEDDVRGLDEGVDFCVMEADSSQLSAVRAASRGESFVLQGPPGTGKSQTIANIIAQCLAEERNVLFVAEKQAALNVVYQRLESVDLDDFCLELHSDSANKRAVAAQLGNAIRMAETHSQTDWRKLAEKLERTRAPINEYVDAIHRERSAGVSLYQGIARLTELQEVAEVAVDLGDQPGRLDEEVFEEMLDAAIRLSRMAAEVEPIAAHPLRLIGAVRQTPDERQIAEERIAGALEDGKRLMTLLEDSIDDVPSPVDRKPDTVSRHASMVSHVDTRPPGARGLVEASDWELLEPRLREAVETGRAYERLSRDVEKKYTDKLMELDLRNLRQRFGKYADAFILWAWIMLFFARRRLEEATRDGKVPPNDEVIEHLDYALELSELEEQIEATAIPSGLDGGVWRGTETDWDVLERALDWTEEFHSRAGQMDGSEEWFELAALRHLPWSDGEMVGSYVSAADALQESWQSVASYLEVEAADWSSAPAEGASGEASDWLSGFLRVGQTWRENLHELRAWSMYVEARDDLVELGLGAIVSAVESGAVTPDLVRPVTERAVLEWWTRQVLGHAPELRKFNELDHERQIEKFRELDERSFEKAREEVRARVSSRIPDVKSASEASEIGTLLREIQKKSKHLPIRELFNRIENLLPRVAPCMLMSPMSVAQYLSADPVDFDLVIFDEASQIPPWNALGAISRANQCVVVGDSNQLPPTTFFTKTYDGGELQEIQDLESILDECVAAGVETRRLAWHYRSRDESLIAFSNFHYYDNELYTFPSALDDLAETGVSYRHIAEGYYDRGGTRTNEAEAEAIVSEIVERLRDEEKSNQSIGVVTFNQVQQRLIEDLLDEQRRAHSEIEPYFSDAAREPVFVKNLENVQGDERDVMMFSICYAPDQTGKLTMNFGPLNRKGGERRLNVAITRSREELIVFATLKSEQIDLTRTSATAVEHLKTFLKYAEIGPRAIAEATTAAGGEDRSTRAIRRRISDHLQEQGWELDIAVGCSGYEIDLAVRHPEHPESYILGIELDGHNYRIGETARDRERTRPLVLESLGWRLHRIWSVEWWHDPDKQLRKLDDRLEGLRGDPPPDLVTETNADVEFESVEEPEESGNEDEGFDSDLDEQRDWVDGVLGADFEWSDSDWARPYEKVTLSEDAHSSDEFDRDRNLGAIAQSACRIVGVEGPVQFDSLARRLARHWGYSRLSARIEKRIRESLGQLQSSERPVIRGEFVWPADRPPEEYRTFRPVLDGERPRQAEEIAPEEAANAAAEVLRHNLGMPEDELCRQVADAFGFSRLGGKLRELGGEAIEVLIEQDRVDRDGEMIRPTEGVSTAGGEETRASEALAERQPAASGGSVSNKSHVSASSRKEAGPVDVDAIMQLPGVGAKMCQDLVDAGYGSIEALAQVGTSELETVKGVGSATAKKIARAVNTMGGKAAGAYPNAQAVGVRAQRLQNQDGRAIFKLPSGEQGLPEQVAAAYFSGEGWRVHWTGNETWWAVTSFLYWDVLFAKIDGVYHEAMPFPSPRQDMPRDLFREEFYPRRKELIERRTEELKGLDLAEQLHRAIQRHGSDSCRLVVAEKLDPNRLLQIAEAAPSALVLGVAERILRHPNNYRNGLPDLTLWKADEFRLAEVKTVGNSLADHQESWLEYLGGLGARPFVVVVGSSIRGSE